MDAFFDEPPIEPRPSARFRRKPKSAIPTRRPRSDPAVADAAARASEPHDRGRPFRTGRRCARTASSGRDRSSRIKVAALAAAIVCIGLAAVGYLRMGDRAEPPPVARTASPVPPCGRRACCRLAAGFGRGSGAGSGTDAATEPMSATEALALPEPVRTPAATTVRRRRRRPNPPSRCRHSAVRARSHPLSARVAGAVERRRPKREASTPPPPIRPSRFAKRSRARRPKPRGRSRREARTPVDQSRRSVPGRRASGPRPVAPQVPQMPQQMHRHSSTSLARAGDGRRGCHLEKGV